MPIRVEGLSYIYNAGQPMEKLALNDVSLTVEDGEFIGLIGHTGSGKSTLVQHFNGLLKPTKGRIYLDGIDIHSKGITLRSVRQQVGMVFQYPEYQLFGETVFEDIAFGPKNMGVSDQELDERVDWALDLVGLDSSFKERSPFELSGGQKRKVAIAGVLAMRPRILILDEPTAGLDPKGRDEILSLVSRLHQQEKTTIILVSHSMEDIARLASRLIVMANGEIVLEGPPEVVFKEADYLEKIGLGVPQMKKLLQALQAQGLDVHPDHYTIEAAEGEIVRLLETK
ncbi:MAG: energy-coupling factor transporter ATPase [Candidatus Wallacebacter cryptica]|nr:energy-coupling factor transporter ATPase [Bacillota bacterium]